MNFNVLNVFKTKHQFASPNLLQNKQYNQSKIKHSLSNDNVNVLLHSIDLIHTNQSPCQVKNIYLNVYHNIF